MVWCAESDEEAAIECALRAEPAPACAKLSVYVCEVESSVLGRSIRDEDARSSANEKSVNARVL